MRTSVTHLSRVLVTDNALLMGDVSAILVTLDIDANITVTQRVIVMVTADVA